VAPEATTSRAGTGNDTIYTAAQTTFGVDAAGPADAGKTNVVDTGTGSDTVYGSTGIDLVTGHSLPPHSPAQTDDIRGGDANDILIGGYGTDKIYGGPGDDYVIAEPSHVDIGGGDDGFGPVNNVSHDPMPAGAVPQHKLLVGGLGRDHIIGGDGGADVYGDQQTTPCVAGSPVASDPVDESVNTVNDGNDKITGGAGVENVRAGGGNDNVDVKANNDLACGEKGNDVLQGGSDNDQEWGGSGQDTIYGDTGNDLLYGNGNDLNQGDTIYGGDGTDQIEGNDGKDWVTGGNDADVVIGGTRAAGRDDKADFLFGDNGADIIIGDNGNLVSGVWVPLDLTGTPASAGGGDFIWGGANNDLCHGGINNDTIFGGSGDDHCEGNAGNDTISGQDGDDELIGGGYETASAGVGFPDGIDTINGGDNADVITGDNALVLTTTPAGATDTVKGRGFTNGHTIALLDLGYSPTAGTSDGDFLHGNAGTDVIYGQGGADAITGDENDDYAEGGPGVDTMNGNGGQDDLVGGSSTVFSGSGAATVGQPDTGDNIAGDDEADVIIGDNGKVLRDPAVTPSPLTNRPGMATQRAIVLYDLQDSPHANSSGDDIVTGDSGVDVILGQDGNDRLKGNAGDDYIEGDQGSDWAEGNAGEDDLVGGSSTAFGGSGLTTTGQLDGADALYGGANDDVITGDNALVLRTGARTSTTDRLGSIANTRLTSRNITLFDLNSPNFLTNPPRAVFGGDRLSGGSETDVIYGQDGNDQVSGGPGADYMEGNGGNDVLRGDLRLDQAPPAGHAATSALATSWPGSASALADVEGNTANPDGQDDMIGGNSRAAFRDGNDDIEGDGESDFQLGDNGTLKRDVQGADGSATERVFVQRYSDTSPIPANAAVIRMHDAAVTNPNGTTRFCTTVQNVATCEVAGAFGNDTMWGDGGDDTMWGQDGNDTMHGGDNNDDMYGELGNDTMFGDAGNDAMLGDRGGVVDELMNPSDIAKQFNDSTSNPPKESFTGFRQGTLDHRIDLLHDIDGDAFVGTSLSAAMPHAGLTEGGIDRMRGGPRP
jgi:Ca2+-binding RTX toxin-like protein